jgi:hypothetical protein
VPGCEVRKQGIQTTGRLGIPVPQHKALADFPMIGGALRTNASGFYNSGVSLVLDMIGTSAVATCRR